MTPRALARRMAFALVLAGLLACDGKRVQPLASAARDGVEATTAAARLPPLPAPPPALIDPARHRGWHLDGRPTAATGFRLERGEVLDVLSVRVPWSAEQRSWALVPRDLDAATRRAALDSLPTPSPTAIEVPVRRLATTSTTELAHLDLLAASSAWIAHVGLKRVSTARLRDRIDAGEVAEVSAGGGSIDVERLLQAEPEVVLADFASRSQLDAIAAVERSGIAVVLMPTFLESSPLGRAEWLRVLGLLLDRETAANQAFERVDAAYRTRRDAIDRQVAARVASGVARPTVLSGAPFDGVWHVPGGETYPARLFADAGAAYAWRDDPSTRALPLDLERVVERATTATWWLWPGRWRTRAEIAASDTRLATFDAWGAGRVVGSDRRLNGLGGNDFWESGVARPDLILADLGTLFHGSLEAEGDADADAATASDLVFHRLLP
ncbi:MAG: ABC transporter substrate-binding protein [Acidobacteriota bacterium]